MTDDAQLLRRYVEERSEEAFAELVRRHVDVVYFAALRRVGGDAHLADDVAQRVFADLARKAASLQGRAALTGWLYTSTRFAAAHAVRSERRRRTHEQEAHTMNELHSTPDPDWNQLRPIIDGAMDELSDTDREAVLLRFFENRPLADVGAHFSLSADAARMRIERALDKLRGSLAKRGVVSTSAALAAVFAAQSGVAAPASVVARIVAGALSKAGSATVTAVTAWTILGGVSVGIAVMSVAVAVFQRGSRDAVSPPAPGAAQAQPRPVASPANRPVAANAVSAAGSPATASVVVPPSSAPAAAAFSSFASLPERQKTILKTLWEHRKIAPNAPVSAWSYKPGNNAASEIVADFNEAAALLAAGRLVAINPTTNAVSLTAEGEAFCAARADELDAFVMNPGLLTPARFGMMPAAKKDILKTLWEHQKVSPDRPGVHWGFRVELDAPDFAAFQIAVASLHEVNGLVGVGEKKGIVFLNERGRAYCEAHAAEIDAYPAPERTFRPLSAASPENPVSP